MAKKENTTKVQVGDVVRLHTPWKKHCEAKVTKVLGGDKVNLQVGEPAEADAFEIHAAPLDPTGSKGDHWSPIPTAAEVAAAAAEPPK